jgi:hypothetical protein
MLTAACVCPVADTDQKLDRGKIHLLIAHDLTNPHSAPNLAAQCGAEAWAWDAHFFQRSGAAINGMYTPPTTERA